MEKNIKFYLLAVMTVSGLLTTPFALGMQGSNAVQMQKHTVLWIHANNEQTKKLTASFAEDLCSFVDIQEVHSVDELKSTIKHFSANHLVRAIVSEMGFWKDGKHTSFDKESGLVAMSLLNQSIINPKGKFVISARVGKNEDNLLNRSQQNGYTHTYGFTPIISSLGLSKSERTMYAVIDRIKQSLRQKPVRTNSQGYPTYPVSRFKIKQVYDIRNSKNIQVFKLKKKQMQECGYPTKSEFLFHASGSEESTKNIMRDNFDRKYLGTCTGNRGSYGMGIYFSTRAYLPILIAIGQEKQHFMFLACKILPGRKKMVKELSPEDTKNGIKIKEETCDSHISQNGLEVVIPNSNQILPYFLITFSLDGITDNEFWIWELSNGNKKKLRCLYSENQNMYDFL